MRQWKSENHFRDSVVLYLKSRIRRSAFSGRVSVQAETPILKDLTMALADKRKSHVEERWKLVAGFQKQDVVMFADVIPKARLTGGIVSPQGIGDGPMRIPLVICELKLGEKTNTHALITYANIAQQVKGVFPFCAYYFIMSSNAERGLRQTTVARQSKGFDRVFLNWNSEKRTAWHDIQSHLEYLERREVIPRR